ncbi:MULTISPECIES: MFS transporter [unclassified Saccharopolyspora]|uniref:MFS transporter n=1 Tax=unclassified Saccharopolyspora TaxID=2646250 RepID=UPI001CD7390D|nr:MULTISPECIES: MFS transporter [unclassified Saccharopolyspora]MCA1185967.1 MFS transporter [Saccharopolyspora sp. 6T]MCA1192867.1 MFS transporter [Saccharopolyspora sp. 6V]MCA1280741.1 MFS transporter [Saccharopolyspora sp. 7B]
MRAGEGTETGWPIAGRRWWALGVLTVPVLLMSVDLTVLSLAVPHLSQDLAPSGTQLLWIIDIYGVFLAGLLILMGAWGDRIGRRRLLLIGSAAFGVASVLAAFAWSPEVLILARALLGVGGATLMPSTLSLIRSVFQDATERRRAISVWMAVFAGGAGLGPVIGGVLLEHFWWGSVFLINVPIMIVLLIIGPVLLPESKDPRPGPFDVLSVILLIAAILAVIFGFKDAGKQGWSFVSIAWILGGILIAWTFTYRQRTLTHPLIDITLFRSLPFTVAVLANVAGVFAMTGVLYFFPQYVQVVLQRSPLEAGLWSLPLAAGAILGSLAAPSVARALSMGWVIGFGLATAACGYLVLSFLGGNEAMLLSFTGGAFLGLGVGVADTLTNDVIIGTAPADKAGAAAGISETAYELGGAMGTAVLGSVGASLYTGTVAQNLAGELPDEVVGPASETVGAASGIATTLPPESAAPFMAVVSDAFVGAMTHTFFAAAVIVALAALGAVLALRKHRSTTQSDH